MPRAAFDDIGNGLTAALISGDFDSYCALMHLPLRIIPRDGDAYDLTSTTALRDDFAQYHAMIQAQGVTDIFRQMREFQQNDAHSATARVLTHIMVKAHRIVDPFETVFHLTAQGDRWKITCIESSEGHIKWTLGRVGISDQGYFTAGEKP